MDWFDDIVASSESSKNLREIHAWRVHVWRNKSSLRRENGVEKSRGITAPPTAQNCSCCCFPRRNKLRLDEFGVKFSRQSFQSHSTPSLWSSCHPCASYSSITLLSLSRVTREQRERERQNLRHAHAATTFRAQKLCLWAEKIYRLRADIHIAGWCILSV